MIGQILNNCHHITALLGEGAMGEVYRATNTQTGQEVAVKVITQKLAFDEEMLARFRREGEALRHLRHANIVAYVDMFPHGQQQVIVMEYVPGGSLARLIQRGPLPVDQAVRIALELSDALAQAHHLGIIHRDLKPDNVLVAEDGRPKLTDFGVARLVSGTAKLTGTGLQMGTPYYMSPEAWEGQQLDGQTDIWSLGVVLFEMLTGQTPFAGETLVSLMNKVLTAPPPDIKQLRADVPPRLVQIIQRMLSRDKAQRYASMREVAVELERVAREEAQSQEAERTRLKEVEQGKQPEGLPAKAGEARPQRTRKVGAVVAGMLVVGGLIAAGSLGLWKFNSANTAIQNTQTALAAQRPAAQTSPGAVTLSSPAAGIESPVVSEKDGMVSVYVPAGEFLMGSKDADAEADKDEKPQHPVGLDAYRIDKTEVTNAMFAKFVAAANYKTDAERAGTGWILDLAAQNWVETSGADWRHPRGPASSIEGLDNHPVVQVSWNDAQAYCAWAGRQLPTEAQWEKAARGAEARKYPWGSALPAGNLLNLADRNLPVSWADPNVNDGYKFTAPVGHYPGGASFCGALDMGGNVWEWVADWYGESTYQRAYTNALPRNPAGPDTGQDRVRRGGSWVNAARDVRATYRLKSSPVFRLDDVGFRCSRLP